jgi:hypothetical protein
LSQIGNKKQISQSERYLSLIGKETQREREGAQQNRQQERERYLKEKKTQNVLGKRPKKEKSLTRAERDLEIQRVQELRTIEKENMAERTMMLGKKSAQGDNFQDQKLIERTDVKTTGTQVPSLMQRDMVNLTAGEKAIQKEIGTKQEAEQPLSMASSSKKGPALKETVYRNIVQPESGDLTKEGAEYREKLDRERIKLEREKELIGKSRNERTRQTQEPVNVKDPKTVESQIKAVISAKEEKLPKTVQEEQFILSQQRAAIKKDFEDGVERLYSEAIDLFKKRAYEEARENFLQVNDMIKGYRKTGYYLGQIDKVLQGNQRSSSVEAAGYIPQSVRSASQITPAASDSTSGRTQAISQALDSLDESYRR